MTKETIYKERKRQSIAAIQACLNMTHCESKNLQACLKVTHCESKHVAI
jgi:hypothetical protein